MVELLILHGCNNNILFETLCHHLKDMPNLTEKMLRSERKYTGKIISVDLLDIELPDGRKAKREVIRHGNAVARACCNLV